MKKIAFTFVALTLIFTVSCKKKEEKTTQEEITTEVKKEEKVETSLRHALEFTAFKTPKKVGVKGTFDKIDLTNTATGNITETLTGAKFSVATESVNTGDPTRDIKLKEFYFKLLAEPTITGTFKSFNDGKATIAIKMNGVEKDIPFEYTATENEILLSGGIDMIADFSANKAFDSIHEACKILHEDKTWTDVSLNITIGK
ncbi:YceI family protein [Joostella sp. CR20]|uniref:YceI family protein n=1 Tax=Joostella sp. CR20 TaxID=2804312 RepID=UPI00313C88AB